MLNELHSQYGLRALVIRRTGRTTQPRRPTVFVGSLRPDQQWLEHLQLARYSELAHPNRLDLTRLAQGIGGFGQPVKQPLFLVCVHGRKDACCAIKGRPVVNALAAAYPNQTWQCTHFGGDRWAGNMLIAPHGFMYGQLDAHSVLPIAQHAQRAEIALDNLRGRTGVSPFAQVAEIAIRERTGLARLNDVLAKAAHITGDHASVEVTTPGVSYRVDIQRRPLGTHGRSLCSGETNPHRFDVLDVTACASPFGHQ
jgi:hypothetical protein